MKFCAYETIKNNLSHQKFQFFLRLWNLNQMVFNYAISTLWHKNVDDYDFFSLENVLPLKIYLG
jgi:hypothetical protein